jgi:site-specific recombinase XerD
VFCAAIDDYVTYLTERGHPPSTIQQYVQAVEHFGAWLRRTRCSVERVDEQVIERFVHGHLARCACPPPCSTSVHQVRASLRHLHIVLRSTQRAATVPSRALSQGETLVREFEEYLRHERGAAEVTCVYSARYAREFVADCFGDKALQFSRVRASTITEFLAARADRWTPGSMKVAAVSLRRFLRYLQMVG